jgi:hypothetical protein
MLSVLSTISWSAFAAKTGKASSEYVLVAQSEQKNDKCVAMNKSILLPQVNGKIQDHIISILQTINRSYFPDTGAIFDNIQHTDKGVTFKIVTPVTKEFIKSEFQSYQLPINNLEAFAKELPEGKAPPSKMPVLTPA